MLRDIPKMLEITARVVKAVKIPVTVKTRLGWDCENKIITVLAEQLQDCGIKAITIHGRTRSQMYTGEADWTLIGEVKNNPRMKDTCYRQRRYNHTRKTCRVFQPVRS